MRLLRYFAVASFTVLAFCAVLLAEVTTDYDKRADFSQYHTYSWGKVKTTNPLWEPRIQEAVDKVLQAKGWKRVDSGGDVVLTAVGAAHDETEYTTFYNGLPGWGWYGFGATAQTTEQHYKVGTLVVDMFDARNKQLIWRGKATDVISDKPEKNEKKLEKAVEKMFEKFPPKGKE